MKEKKSSLEIQSHYGKDILRFSRMFRAGFGRDVELSLVALSNIPTASAIIAFMGDKPVGAATLVDYDTFRQIGNFVIRKSCRLRGLGSILLDCASEGILPTQLVADKSSVQFYQKNGFCLKETAYLVACTADSAKHSPVQLSNTQHLTAEDIDFIGHFEKSKYGMSRSSVLSGYLNTLGCLGLKSTSGSIINVGYGMRLGPWFGPVRAQDDVHLATLLSSPLTSGNLRMGVVHSQLSRIQSLCQMRLKEIGLVYTLTRGKGEFFGLEKISNPILSPFFLG